MLSLTHIRPSLTGAQARTRAHSGRQHGIVGAGDSLCGHRRSIAGFFCLRLTPQGSWQRPVSERILSSDDSGPGAADRHKKTTMPLEDHLRPDRKELDVLILHLCAELSRDTTNKAIQDLPVSFLLYFLGEAMSLASSLLPIATGSTHGDA